MAANEHNGWMRFFWILVLIRLLNDVESLLYIHPDRCQSGNYFDTLQLRCKSCADHFDVNGTEFDQSFRTDFNDRTKCLCPDSYRFMIENDRIRCRKIDCLNGQILHNGICQRCADESCLCPSGMILRRISLDEVRCESCRFGDPDCDQCDRSFYNIDAKRCHCPQSSTHIIEDGQCLDRTKILLQNLLISYSKISSLNSGTHLSKFVFDSLRPAILNCESDRNQTACQYLINVCVLKSIGKLNGVLDDLDWCQDLQTKFIASIDKNQTKKSGLDYDTDPNQFNNRPNQFFKLIGLRLQSNGSLIEFGPIDLNAIFLCANETIRNRHLVLGVFLHKKCRWSNEKMWNYAVKDHNNPHSNLNNINSKRNIFFQIYRLSERDNYSILSFRNDYYQNRFTILDTKFGLTTAMEQLFIIFARKIELKIYIETKDLNEIQLDPKISIQYEILWKDSNPKIFFETELMVTFQKQSSTNEDNLFQLDLSIIFIAIAMILWSIFRTWVMLNRLSLDGWNSKLSVYYLVLNLSIAFSNVAIIAVLIMATSQTIVFKFQSALHALMFTEQQEKCFLWILLASFACKVFEFIHKFYRSQSIEIFFIDWEKSRSKDSDQQQQHWKNSIRTDKERSSALSKFSRLRNSCNSKWSIDSHPFDSINNVSVWRIYFIANEWSELITRRRINLGLHLIILLSVLKSDYFENFIRFAPENYQIVSSAFSQNDPNQRQTILNDEIIINRTIRSSTTALIYLILILLQYLYRRYISETISGDKLDEFIDLCSVSNISVFCLQYPKYGYYVHGISPHGHSEVNMLEMYRLLDIEESDLCSQRGLLPNSDQQTFEIYLPSNIHNDLQGYRFKITEQSRHQQSISFSYDQKNIDKFNLVSTYNSINNYLMDFIAHSSSAADYIVEERSSMEYIFDFESSSASVSQGIGTFYNGSCLVENYTIINHLMINRRPLFASYCVISDNLT
ncbi:GTP-binding protein 5 [Sarcoptes scabiei]|nr:GTP-binding protein 5 [Sarcoptes scabiei]